MKTTDPPTEEEIRRVASALVIRKRVDESSGPHAICDCPACGKPRHLYLNLHSGMWDCKKCEASGSLWALATHLGLRLREKKLVTSAAAAMRTAVGRRSPAESSTPIVKREKLIPVAEVEKASARLFVPGDAEGAAVLAYLKGRGFDETAIRHFRLGVAFLSGPREVGVGIPYLEGTRCTLMKLRNLATSKDERRFARTKGSASGLFNVDGIKDRKRVVLVEGELDAVAVWQSGVTEVCSTSLGAKKEIPVEWREALQAADDIVLWYDDDEAGTAAAQVLVEGLGVHRVRLASIPEGVAAAAEKITGKHPKDAADLIAAGVDAGVIQAIVANAKAMHTANVVQPSSYADYLAAQIDKGAEVLGTPTGWASIDRLMRGIRPCEVTLVTGHTGHGKTTWTTDLLENLAKQGVPVLLSALEDGPELLVTRLFQRQYGRPISSIVTEADRQRAHDVIARLDANPVYLIDAYGRASKQELFDAIRYAVVRLGVLFVGIDHVHFVRKDDPRQDDREHLDAFMMDLVALAMELRIHVFLIAHPRGGVELSVIPTGEHVKGSSTMKQVAQNGISVYRADEGLEIGGRGDGRIRITDAQGRRVEMTLAADQSIVYVWKCRHPDAKQGAAMLRFDGRCLSFREDMPPAFASRTEVDSPLVADDAWGSTSFGA